VAELETELEKLEARLSEIYASGDQNAAREAGRRHNEIKPIVDAYREYRATESDLADARELLASEDDTEMRDYLDAEIETKDARLAELDAQLRELLIPRDPDAGRNVIVEIRGGEGGEEGNLWAADLFHMYEGYADLRRWKVEVLDRQLSDMGGFRDITFVVKGDDAWSRLKHEAGVHRVQRVPVTESQGRVHTSAASVAVLPEAEEVDVEINEHDLQVDVYRSSGPGGQSVNTTDSAVRLTHKPTGLVVTCQDEKSQLQNKEKALRILRSRLLEAERERQEAEMSSTRRDQVKSGGRSDKIRTYNYKENRVTDHRIGLTLHSLDNVLTGQLDDITDALAVAERTEQLGGDGAP
jgi:peptide chain release factor 1